MVLLYQGTEVDDNNITTDRVPRTSCELEARIASLEESIREKDKKIALFENEIIVLKVNLMSVNCKTGVNSWKLIGNVIKGCRKKRCLSLIWI